MEKEDMPGNEDKIEKPDGEDKTDVPDAHPKEDQISQEKEDIEQPQEQIEIPENDLTASEQLELPMMFRMIQWTPKMLNQNMQTLKKRKARKICRKRMNWKGIWIKKNSRGRTL